jgi:hypothetical protein
MIVPLVTLASLFLATKALSQSPGHGNYRYIHPFFILLVSDSPQLISSIL